MPSVPYPHQLLNDVYTREGEKNPTIPLVLRLKRSSCLLHFTFRMFRVSSLDNCIALSVLNFHLSFQRGATPRGPQLSAPSSLLNCNANHRCAPLPVHPSNSSDMNTNSFARLLRKVLPLVVSCVEKSDKKNTQRAQLFPEKLKISH